LTKNYQYVVMDNEAGMEHFSRLTTHDVDLLFIISDSSIRGLHAVRRILDLIQELNLAVAKTAVLVSQVRGDIDSAFEQEARRLHVDVAGFIPFDENVASLDMEGKPTYKLPESSPAVQALGEVLERLL
jgi:CO dehydrogenase maturation factor